ncbi:MAG: hypothetical protein IKP95_11155 [Ruminococcus sp.]|nr:hypothetical protein [Ruminococcus sp.]
MKKLVRIIITAFAVVIMQGSIVATAIDLPFVPADSSVTDSNVVSQTDSL